jgi:hypothetical protein
MPRCQILCHALSDRAGPRGGTIIRAGFRTVNRMKRASRSPATASSYSLSRSSGIFGAEITFRRLRQL